MPTAEYIKAVNLLNSKCYKNWRIAFEMCNDEEKKIIRKVMSGEDTVLSDKKEITLRKLENGKLMRHYYEYRHHPEYPNILVNSNGRIFQIKTKVSESDSEVTYIVNKRNRISYNKSGNGRIAIFSAPVLIKNLVYDTFIGGRKKGEEIMNINGNKRDNRVDNLRLLTPLDRLMRHNLYPHLNEIVGMQKRNVKLEFIAGKFNTSRSALRDFLIRARKLGVVE
ncbi:HNH endonuclease [Enterococcus cecorum]|uniref:HNH endonuclease n=1 Tax=Enterococcus cecorum TaxID=44008 RepID=UPI001FABA137|nr:HNH endonuclease [Enterococcus cecorum]MCJ0572155.1 HNH endonuclease [Enterococcus cecorum]MCJ0590485.1 HNH endonuclease [Enterococcus cecorum]